jgi:hypothetical protein
MKIFDNISEIVRDDMVDMVLCQDLVQVKMRFSPS